jgi:Rrf2 family transcriptional regulator, iron-sulfur cluster assembly transcription factor
MAILEISVIGLSQTAEYAVRAVYYLAQQGTGKVSADAIARALAAPANYMSKTLHQLARAGIVEGTRGPTGGFRLAVPPEDLTVARVAEIFGGPPAIAVCLLGGRPCDSQNPCVAHERWTAVTDAVKAPLENTTIADLLAGSWRPRIEPPAVPRRASAS